MTVAEPWSIVILGRPISKKNSKQIRVYGGRKMVVSSDAHEKWLGLALVQVIPRRPEQPLSGPLEVDVAIDCKGRLDLDVDNGLTSVLDLLVTANVIEDDALIRTARVTKRPGHSDWRVAVTVTSCEASE